MTTRYSMNCFVRLLLVKRLSFFVTVWLSLFLLPSLVTALDMKNLGTVSVLVSDESEEQRKKAIQEALAIVLVRLSGQNEVLDSAATQEIFKQANSYLLQFSYETLDNTNEYAALLKEDYLRSQLQTQNNTNSTQPSSLKILKLMFGQQIVLKKLQEAKQAVWDTNRPEVMLWWVSEEQAVRKIVSESELKESRTNFQYFAEQRGVPIKLPLMDLQDQGAINASDIWGGFAEPLVNANKRYGVTTWVQGKSYYSQGEWHAYWQINLLGESRAFKTQSESLRAVQKAVIASIAKLLASEYAVVLGENATEIYINVSDVSNLDDFSKLKQYLDNLFVVDKVEMRHIKADQAAFKLYLKEDVEKFKKLLALDKKLQEVIEVNPLVKIENIAPVPVNEQAATAQNEVVNTNVMEQVKQPESLAINYIQYRWAGK